MADNSTDKLTLDQIREENENLPHISNDTPAAERREIKARADELSKAAEKAYADKLKNEKNFDEDEKKILKLYNEGVQNYAIAKKVFKFVNQDTVGKVILTVRKAHADDYDEVEDVNSTKGYTGAGQ